MDIQNFIEKFADQFEDTERSEFTADTKFKSLEEWDSLVALSIIAMADDEFDVKVTGEDIRTSNTIQELFDKVAK